MEECIICFEDTNEFMFYNCAHKVCKKCYVKINTCPLCNTPRDSIIIQPRNEVVIRQESTSAYTVIKCVGIFLLISMTTLYFYKHQ